MPAFEVYAEIAKWAGWPAVSALLVMIIGLLIYVDNKYRQVLQERNHQLQKELAAERDFSPDQLLRRLTQRHASAMKELETIEREKETATHKLEAARNALHEMGAYMDSLEQVHREFRDEYLAYELKYDGIDKFKARWEADGHCSSCEQSAPPKYSNYIDWSPYLAADIRLKGAADLVSKLGVCHYCSAIQVVCARCGAITSISPAEKRPLKCAGGCGTGFWIPFAKDAHFMDLEVSAPMANASEQTLPSDS